MVLRRAHLGWMLLFACVGARASDTCTCETRSDEERFDLATHVFVARIRSLEDVAPMTWQEMARDLEWQPAEGIDYGLKARYTSLATVKGNAGAVPALVTGYGGSDCGVMLMPGTTYLVASEADGHVDRCSLVRRFELVNCTGVALLERLRARAADGTTPIAWPSNEHALGYYDAKVGDLVDTVADPYSLHAVDCAGR
ncbi:MAG TPA: hypothetical protein VFL14_12695 [Xanthomonadales bacterium]|nr:hypothetical protein [Xanthomonadales bacterium]